MKFLSYIYKFIINFRNYLYKINILKSKGIDGVKIICIGNITVGGTGKTPTVQYLVKKMKKNHKIAIVLRGYKGKRKVDPLIISNREKIIAKLYESGEEAYFHAKTMKNIPVIVGKNRYEACKLAVDKFEVDTIILDDGFQHLKLKRDENIILIDATNPFGNGYMLPYGILREPLEGLERADKFIITKSNLVDENKINLIKKELEKYNKDILLAKHSAKYIYDLKLEKRKLDFIKGKSILLVSGLGNPKSFENTVMEFDPKKIKRVDYPDHYSYNIEDIKGITEIKNKENFDIILTTEKDFIKFPLEDIENDVVIRKEKEKIFVLKIEFETV
ncbi:tetraacyldisaccharide 4'-kinase [Haliovirga abyssi]|uniref:Tetraacyldisaccharide 4'-kinase n=1 Tax=Haliovirga abyssi TaxID=2996794 RepID=A0AAU9DWJ9_9FUSO|nr:tetraacyldisaccharide 4'-kinase [Haliovirga abyssi]BDU50656.1 tetraacyldisaccharide 4'-kinase [Haliovirga abyssi]